MESLPKPAHARVARILNTARLDESDELARQIITLEREDAAVLLRVAPNSRAGEWSVFGSAGAGLDETVIAALSSLLQEILHTHVPLMRRVSTGESTGDGDVLGVPLEPPEGAPLGILLVMRHRRYDRDDVDFYRLLGLRIAEILVRRGQ